jgi:hypothetical protein
LLSNGYLALQVDLDVHQVESPVVAMLDPVIRLLVKQSLNFVPVLLELHSVGELVAQVVDKVTVDVQLFVVLDELV